MTKHSDIFAQIKNAILDLQSSEYQTFQRPLKTLARLLQHPELESANTDLTFGLDLDAFLKENEEQSTSSMRGTDSLKWHENNKEFMGLCFLLIKKFSDNPDFMVSFGHEYFNSGSKRVISGVHGIVRALIIPFVRDYEIYVLNNGVIDLKITHSLSSRIFIVHGHDGEARETVARFVSSIGLEPIILHEQANRGRTVIEKVEANSDVSFAIVLLTPDDEGSVKGGEIEPRARQNVLLELGYFIGKLGRERVCALKRGVVEIPSDFAGVVWEAMDDGNGWKMALARELQAAGHKIDWNKVMR